MGELHLEILQDRMKLEFGVQSNSGKPQIAYRETITKSARGEFKIEPRPDVKPQYAHVIVKVSPLKRGGGFTINNRLTNDEIPKVFIESVLAGLKEGLYNGVVMGYPVVDVEVDLIGGSAHDTDSNDHAFRMAAITAVRNAFQDGASILLEPIMSVDVDMPEEYQGEIIGDLNRRRGKINNIESRNGLSQVKSEVPLAEMFGYSTDMRNLSKGRASFSMEPLRFEEVPGKVLTKLTEHTL